MLTHMGHKFSEEEVEEILTAADVNGDGQLDYEGLLSYSTWIACYSHFSGVVREGLGVGNGSDGSVIITVKTKKKFE